jgi:hypothetical protein
MHPDVAHYNATLAPHDRAICAALAALIKEGLRGAESKLWHGHPVWFLDGNPIVGYSKQKAGLRLMFWSGAAFDEPRLHVVGEKFKDASIFYADVSGIVKTDVRRWLKKARIIQFDYKNIVKRRGTLVRLPQAPR